MNGLDIINTTTEKTRKQCDDEMDQVIDLEVGQLGEPTTQVPTSSLLADIFLKLDFFHIYIFRKVRAMMMMMKEKEPPRGGGGVEKVQNIILSDRNERDL